jgi:16S rRNA (uracil1498-N3)-methyltransferase
LSQEPLEDRRFYLPPGAIDKHDIVTFPENESIHIVSSLRMAKGDTVSATDGKGMVCKVLLEHLRDGQVTGRIVGATKAYRQRPLIHLFQGIVRSSRMDWVVEKCTELGIAGFVPVYTERSVRHLSGHRLGRLRRIAVEAMKQSLGGYLPDVGVAMSFEDALSGLEDFDLVLVAWEGEPRRTLRDATVKSPRKRMALWVGPEGGFTDREISSLAEKGALMFTLGRLRLKSETAAVASVATLRHLLSPGPSGERAR